MQMAQTMKAAVVRQFRAPLTIEEMEVPTPGAGQVLVKYEATGVCHTDLHAANGDWPVKPAPPFIPGHEGVGFVSAVGAGVRRVKEGDKVGVPWLHTACGYCTYCRTGWETLCASQSNTGYSVNGTFAEFGLADPEFVGKIPDGLEFGAAAPVLCAGVTVYKGLKETEVRPGEWVAISGVGGLGHMAVQYAKAMGMHVVAADIFEDKLALAKQLGADIAINGKSEDAIEQVKKATSGGVHGVLVTAVSPAAMEQAFGFLRSKGTMVLVGLPPGMMSLPVFETVLKRITVRGSIVGTRQDLEESLVFAAEGKVKPYFSWESLENINDIFHRMEAGKIDGRIVVRLQ
ncbi:alcohol dehydrogenase AdhP [Sinorhizobium meliloti]|uniref:alcohol dehydrogenase AdhP n=1 Tax=Rhizobium meliloti TaxID=382 RepID=UPI000A307497|nr:alcohol dehydrogenase AdhP [Sinorhizobium meliloti]MCO6425649.1 alcohol dehydrogenase AdhP [Sinorhizobium meliloti]MDE3774523.1 alcohol dehydrogenase AdhP [Sinorhizobium meliloti]MDE4548036.1 alcohol dehydrogenase AdhP [Sinorhizobium meliloti]MDE4571655.1 alcohol dehydrogenase AdhP [Sinorhizobium meliloti]MDW9763881.1 alcohol dehydrogenase AdhP [Sinorhizobium meliloti]